MQFVQLARPFGNGDLRVTTSTRRPGYFWQTGRGRGGHLTWLGFGFAPRFPFYLGCVGLVRLGSRLFALLAALAHPPPGAAGHQQGRGRLGAWKGSGEPTGSRVNVWWRRRKKKEKKKNTASGVSLCCCLSTSQPSQELFLTALCVFFLRALSAVSEACRAPACWTALANQ